MNHRPERQKYPLITRNKDHVNIREIESHFADMMERIPLVFFEIDTADNLTYINQAGVELFGLTDTELEEGVHCLQILTPESYQLINQTPTKATYSRQEVNTAIMARKKDGTVFPVRIYSSPIMKRGAKIGLSAILIDVTKQHLTEAALLESEGRFRMLFQTANDSIMAIHGGKVIDCNAKTLEIFRLAKQQIVGHPPWVHSPEEQPDGRLSRDVLAERIDLALQGSPQFFEWRYCRSDSAFDAEVSLHRIEYRGKIIIQAMIRDVMLRKQASDKLRKSEEQYRLLIENANDAIFVVQDGFIKFTNKKTDRILGYHKDDLQDRMFTDLIHPEDRKIVLERYLQKIKEEHNADATPFRYIDKRGRIKWAEISSALIAWDDRPAVMVFTKDVTDRKRIEENLQKSFRRNFEKVQKTLETTIETIGLIVETRDPYTSGHQKRVAILASAIANEMNLFEEQKSAVRTAATVHDVGKIYIPAEVLSKPGKLTPTEFGLMKTHPQVGYDILKNIEFPSPIATIVLQHHERIDGSGYPKGLNGKNIFIEARIIAVADVVEAMASHRPYRPTLGLDMALEEISKNRGIFYDADVVDACLSLFLNKGFKLPSIS
jgi:PAS domain S-box-containing protein/putative nucleotidyltransferase with HDIG domain